MISKVLRVEVVGPKELAPRVLEEIQELGVVHVDPSDAEPLGLSEKEKEKMSLLRELRAKVASLEGVFGEIPAGEPKAWELDALRERLEQLSDRVSGVVQELEGLRARAATLGDLAKVLELVPEEGSYLVITLARRELSSLELVRDWLGERGLSQELRAVPIGGDRVAVVVVAPQEHLADLREFLYREGFNIFEVPKELAELRPSEAKAKVSEELAQLPTEVKRVEAELASLREELAPQLAEVKATITSRLAFLKTKGERLGATRWNFHLVGWVKNEDAPKLRERLKKLGVIVELGEPDPHHYPEVPVAVHNNPVSRPLEFVLEMYQYPMYGTFDPSTLLFVFFPFYFGFMLGDVGYGLVVLLLFSFLRSLSKPNTMLRKLANTYIWCGAWTVAFGFLYGEFFGDLGESLLGMVPLFHRLHGIMPLLGVSVAFGVVQVLLGMLLAFLINLKLRHYKHAAYEFLRLVGIGGIIAAVAGGAGLLPKAVIWPTVGLSVASAVGVGILHGLVAPLELISAIGNMLSFVRLAAIGLASAILANIANTFFKTIPWGVGALVVALLFHALNSVLGVFDPTIQGMRLQLVEFFSKFYKGTEKVFTPLTKGGESYA